MGTISRFICAKRSRGLLELSGVVLILAHNHSAGDPTAARTDIQMTQQIVVVANPLGISVNDYISFGKDGPREF
jgi:DNA repair protein RadC